MIRCKIKRKGDSRIAFIRLSTESWEKGWESSCQRGQPKERNEEINEESDIQKPQKLKDRRAAQDQWSPKAEKLVTFSWVQDWAGKHWQLQYTHSTTRVGNPLPDLVYESSSIFIHWQAAKLCEQVIPNSLLFTVAKVHTAGTYANQFKSYLVISLMLSTSMIIMSYGFQLGLSKRSGRGRWF